MKLSRSWRPKDSWPLRVRCLYKGSKEYPSSPENKSILENLFCLGFSWTPYLGFGWIWCKGLFRQRWLMLGPTRSHKTFLFMPCSGRMVSFESMFSQYPGVKLYCCCFQSGPFGLLTRPVTNLLYVFPAHVKRGPRVVFDLFVSQLFPRQNGLGSGFGPCWEASDGQQGKNTAMKKPVEK